MSVSEDVTATLRAQEHQHQPLVLTHALDYHPNDSRIGLSSNLDISQTLTGRMGTGGNNVPLLMASGQTRAEIVSGLSPTLTCQHEAPILANDMRIRRLTPLECCRLQGFPDDWCQGLVNDHPDQDEIEFWHKVFDQWGKPKTEKQIRKWLASPHSDAAEYKMWGNGIALPCAEFVLGAIKRYEEESS